MTIQVIFGGFPPQKIIAQVSAEHGSSPGCQNLPRTTSLSPIHHGREAGSSYLRDPERSYLRNRGLPPFACGFAHLSKAKEMHNSMLNFLGVVI